MFVRSNFAPKSIFLLPKFPKFRFRYYIRNAGAAAALLHADSGVEIAHIVPYVVAVFVIAEMYDYYLHITFQIRTQPGSRGTHQTTWKAYVGLALTAVYVRLP